MPVLVTGFSSVNQLVAAGRAAVKTPEGLEMRAVLLSYHWEVISLLLLMAEIPNNHLGWC